MGTTPTALQTADVGQVPTFAPAAPQAPYLNGKRPARCASHCVKCSRCFAGDVAFDAHIRYRADGSGSDHIDPADVARLHDVGPGECHLQNGPPLAGVPIWSTTSDADRERIAALAGRRKAVAA